MCKFDSNAGSADQPLIGFTETRLDRDTARAQIRLEGLHYAVDVPVHHGGLPNLPKELWHIGSAVAHFLMWRPGEVKQLHILRGIRAVFRPGTATLILGSPGSGVYLCVATVISAMYLC